MSEVILRPATPDDAAILAEMEKLCFSDPWDIASFETILQNPAALFIIAEVDGCAVGYSGMTVVLDECDIINIAVLESHRRLGIGRKMVAKVLEICRSASVTNIYLEHRISNTPAAALYESFGFMPYGQRKKYYKNPVEDAVLRVLEI